MSKLLVDIRKFMSDNNLDLFLVNSTNEFLVEYNSLNENSRYALTGFSGSTGDAVVTIDKCFLFVDGRYHIQADLEVSHNTVSVVKLQTGETMLEKMKEIFPQNSKIGIVSRKNSQARVENFKKFFRVTLFDFDPVEPEFSLPEDYIEDVSVKLAGLSFNEKFNNITSEFTPDTALILTNSEGVSYLFNKRDFSKPYASKIAAKAIVTKNGAEFFTRRQMILQLLKNV